MMAGMRIIADLRHCTQLAIQAHQTPGVGGGGQPTSPPAAHPALGVGGTLPLAASTSSTLVLHPGGGARPPPHPRVGVGGGPPRGVREAPPPPNPLLGAGGVPAGGAVEGRRGGGAERTLLQKLHAPPARGAGRYPLRSGRVAQGVS